MGVKYPDKFFSVSTSECRIRVDSTRLDENTAAYTRNVLFLTVTCRSLTLENQFVDGRARGTTGQEKTFPCFICRSAMPQNLPFPSHNDSHSFRTPNQPVEYDMIGIHSACTSG